MRSARFVAVALLVLAACGPARKGPLTIDVPKGWLVTRADDASLQIANGTAGSDTGSTPGTAKAVFDIYFGSQQTPDRYRELLSNEKAESRERTAKVGGHLAVVFEYKGASFAGSQEAVIVPDYGVLIVYRAAYPNDDDNFTAWRTDFRAAVRSIRFVQPPVRTKLA